MEGKEIVVTGGAGFIGSHIVDSLVEENHVRVIDNLDFGREEYVNDDAELKKVDIRNFSELKKAVGSPDVIFHLAARAQTRSTSIGWDNPQLDCEVNTEGTINLFEAVREKEIDPKIVYASSAAVYGPPENPPITEEHPKNPISPYGVHKFAGEKHMTAYVEEQGLDISAVRIFNTFGPRQPRYVMYDFFKKLQEDNSELEVLGTGRQIRDYCYISDTVRAFEIVAEEGGAGEAYNLSGENVISINDLAEKMIDIADLDADYYNTAESWDGDISRLEADISKLKDLGFRPKVGLDKGLEKFKNYFERKEGSIMEE